MIKQFCKTHKIYYNKLCVYCKDNPTPSSPIGYLSIMDEPAEKYYKQLKKR